MVDFEKIVNTEIEIYRIEIFFLISKSVFTESVFEICNFNFDFKSIISKFYKSIWNRFLHYKSMWKRDYGTLIHQQCPKQIDLKPIQYRKSTRFLLINRYENEIMEPLFINSAQIYIGLISIYYRHRCQTGEKATEEQKSVIKRLF